MTYKTPKQMFEEKQKNISKAIEKKEVRQSKTEMSIGFRWAVNVSVAFLPEELKGTQKGFKQVEKWLEKFQDLDRNYMIENMPLPEPAKITYEDIKEAQKEAPKAQAEQEKADEIPPEIEEANIKADEMLTSPEAELPAIET